MEKLDEGFFDQYTDDFADYFENQRVMRIMLGSEYKKINKAICEIKNKYPNVVTFGVRIDIWTHLMRECIINYVH